MDNIQLVPSVALSTDYVWRGYSQTDNDPAISGSFDYAHASGFYAGTWASNVSFATDTDIEIDVYAGFGGELDNGLGWDIGWLRYIYPWYS
ncbi:MAG: TorF family putative porin [Gammaproteobacteria bacterium]|nr:TorF family putative porin [Gammaproteobacteria bacterium]